MPSSPPPLPCQIPDSPGEMRRRIGEAKEVIRGVVTSTRVLGLDPPHEGQWETEFRFKVAEVMTGSMRAGGEILITAIGSVEAVLPAGLEHVVPSS